MGRKISAGLDRSRNPSRGGSHACPERSRRAAGSRAWEPALLQNRYLLRLALAVIVFAGLAWVTRVQAQSEAWAAVFAHANRLYEEGRYEEAAAKYEEIVASGLQNGRVYYNLGNAYFKQEKLGLAILNYERAHRLMPRDEDIKANLAYARSQIVDKIETPDPGLLGRWLASLQGLLTPDETIILAWTLYLVMTVLALLAVFVWRWRRFCLYALGFLGVLLILSLASLGVKLYQQEHVREALVTTKQVDVLSGPGENYLLEFTVHEGTTLTVEEERGDWWRVRLWGDLEGWTQKAGLQEI
jgi:tetratricopeptide (TPR) repeat protein